MRQFLSVLVVVVLGLQAVPHTQATRLQIHFMDVGQGDGAILIAPTGETVMFDNGVWNQCTKPTTYLTSIGITKVDYQVISHYHRDHYGCTATVLGLFPLQQFAFDRGGSYHDATAFNSYLGAVGNKRRTATDGQVITLKAVSKPQPRSLTAPENAAGRVCQSTCGFYPVTCAHRHIRQ